MVTTILRKGANPNAKARDKRTSLMLAAYMGNAGIVEILIAGGADVNARSAVGGALNYVANQVFLLPHPPQKYFSVAEILIKHGADIDSRDQLGNTPLIRASSSRYDTAMARFLIQRGARLDAQNSNGDDALCVACSADMIRVLIENGADINREIERGKNLLIIAAKRNCLSAVEFYLQNGFDANATTTDGYSALHLSRGVKVARYLLDHGANVNLRDRSEMTPLMRAVSPGYEAPELVTLYLERGADINARNLIGMTALRLAEQNRNDRVIKILRRHGAQE